MCCVVDSPTLWCVQAGQVARKVFGVLGLHIFRKRTRTQHLVPPNYAPQDAPYNMLLTHTMGLPHDAAAVVKHLRETIQEEHAEDGCSITVLPNERPMRKSKA